MVFRWMLESCTLELGQSLTHEMLLMNPERDKALIDQAQLDAINASGVGEYTVSSVDEAKAATCTVVVRDTVGPKLELQSVERLVGRSVKVEDFVVSATDLSGVTELRFAEEPDISREATYTVVIEAVDGCGNVTAAEATLTVAYDHVPPYFSGDLSAMYVEKYSSPDFLSGVSAYDGVDGWCEVTCDTGKLDLTKAGTYYITYYASDRAGNMGNYRRRVVVNHDAEDTAALVQSIASGLGSDPEAIRDYVRNRITYSYDWGGSDPVWFGFNNNHGNCYVHALCLRALLSAKGYETQLIWVTDQTHYWLIIHLGDGWKHIDATPGPVHTRYSLMNDEQRLATLSGRVWDPTQWPACE